MSGCLTNSSVSDNPFPDVWMLFSKSVEEGMAEMAPFECCWRNCGAVFGTAPFCCRFGAVSGDLRHARDQMLKEGGRSVC